MFFSGCVLPALMLKPGTFVPLLLKPESAAPELVMIPVPVVSVPELPNPTLLVQL
ncbi:MULTISPECIES: hypothetical protein [Mycobacterium]|uniref:hypothetical protein n=1 Tax=Mycobacterium TaxID=1763 RepID=UPI0012E37E19|nr:MULTISPECIES: hypothetical protein [Mycobacterium]MDP7731833.1 hypothetical protein [Mycobacterium sp. TY813]